MKIFNIIFGILSILIAITCLLHPFASQITYGYIIAIFVGCMGMLSIVTYFMTRKQAKSSPVLAAVGTANLILGVLCVIFMVLNMTVPFFTYTVQEFAAVVCMLFLGIEGANCIFAAIANKAESTGTRVLTGAFGALMIIGCLTGIMFPAIIISMFGIFLGATFMVQGISRLALAFFA